MFQPLRVVALAALCLNTTTTAPPTKALTPSKKTAKSNDVLQRIIRELPARGPKVFYVLRVGTGTASYERIQGHDAVAARVAGGRGEGEDVQVLGAWPGNSSGDAESNAFLIAVRNEKPAGKDAKATGPVWVLEAMRFNRYLGNTVDFAKRNADNRAKPNYTNTRTRAGGIERRIHDDQRKAEQDARDYLANVGRVERRAVNIVRFPNRQEAQVYLQVMQRRDWATAHQQFRYTTPEALKRE